MDQVTAGNDPTSLAGTRLPYGLTLHAPLGCGGMGVVWRGRYDASDLSSGDQAHRKDVAVKFMAPESESDASEDAALFLREAKALGRVVDPHVVSCLQEPLGSRRPYMVLECVEGEDLAAVIRRMGPQPVSRVREVLRQLALALGAAHRAGVVHHDVTTENVIITGLRRKTPKVTLIDFGLARHCDDRPLPRDEVPVGTPYATSPEQVLSPTENDPRCDVWGFCVVAYCMLVGGPPFGASDMLCILSAIDEQSFVPVTRLRTDVPKAIDAFFHTAFQRRRVDRFKTLDDAARALAAALDRGARPIAACRRPTLPPIQQEAAE
jgi:eukaryotic-like serine/threonine-protein kinase